ncbi:hypothetical protein [Cupriavidus sp. TMH.W2]|uniref:hypothetical protein n=1 Tax=Cupriavidus sp. TMH.W2 TaxID=3434465 RepID=UPI003D776EEE
MKKNATTATLAKLVLATSIATLLAACGGGGGDSASNGNGNGGTTPQTPAVQNPTDPYTGKDAAGTPTATISGLVMNAVTAGATVTAYTLNPDGSNGAALGTATTGSDGKFTMTLSQTPAGMIRLIAVDGTFTSEGDGSVQKNGATELVAPFVTTALSNFVITPISHYASQRLTYLAAKQGKTLSTAYTDASSAAMQAVTGINVIASANRSHNGIDYLAIVPGSAQDTLNTYADALKAIELYAVKYDLPSRTAVRLLAQSYITAFPQRTGVDGQPINVGKWVGSAFDESQPFTLTQMNSADLPNTEMLSIVQAMNADQACVSGDHTAYYQRFPLNQGQSDYLDSTGCTAYSNRINDIKAKQATNNRSKYAS